MKNILFTFLGLFLVGFLVGAIHATKDNSEPKDISNLIDQISENLTLEAGDSTSWISYKCKSKRQALISFENFQIQTDPNFEFRDKKTTLSFMSFDRIYATVGGGLLLSWSIKDIFKSGSEAKNKLTVGAAIIGAISGYSLGYYLFKSDKVNCASTQIEAIFSDKEKLKKIKKRIIGQVLISDVLIYKSKDTINCFYLGKMSFGELLNCTNQTRMIKDTVFFNQFAASEIKYRNSYKKLWSDSIDSFKTVDLNNLRTRIALLKQTFTSTQFLNDKFSEYKIKPVTELNAVEIKKLLDGS